MAKKANFEQAMKRLEAIVRRLEEGDVPLEESIALYEEGMRLGALCGKILTEAQQRIERLAPGAANGAETDDE
jgi:exodeoxyribonuclease VII small subunit